MRIGIVGVPYFTGGGTITRPLQKFLRKADHEVVLFNDYYLGPHTTIQKQIRRLLGWRLGLRYRERIIRRDFQTLLDNVRQARCDVIITVEQGEILLHDLLGARKIFYANAPTGHEVYFQLAKSSGPFDLEAYRTACEKEIAYYQASDAVIFCWNTHVDYVEKHVYQGDNIVRHPRLGWYGCDPQSQRAQYGYPPLIAHVGLVTAYWNNVELLQRLVRSLPYAINFYGKYPIPADLELRYQGFAESLDVLRHYQFGLHSATKDLVRRYGFASKLMTYLSYGLPALSPEWQLVSHQLEGVMPYNEDNVGELLDDAAEPTRWQELADMAYEQAHELEWNKVLEPLLDLI